MNAALGLLIFFGAGLSLLMALREGLRPDRGRFQALLPGLLGLLLLEFFLTHALGWVADMGTHPWQTAGFLLIRCARFSLGPVFLAAYLTLTTYPARGPRFRLHFIPQVLAWGMSLAYLASALGGWTCFGLLRRLMGILTDLSQVHMVLYAFLAVAAARAAGEPRRLVAVQWTAAGVLAVAGCLLFYGATGWKTLEFASHGLLALAVILHFLWGELQPGGLERFGREARSQVYQRRVPAGVDAELLGARLKDLMVQEKVYCDELLTLEGLAERLGISRNRLSEYLNGVLGTSFNAYLNAFRVEEAKRLLRRHPERSVLACGLAAGFNSKSAFYDAFKRWVGRTPQAFRQDP